jgi:hypothetical protein
MVDFKSTLSASGMDPQAGYTGQQVVVEMFMGFGKDQLS